LIFTSNRDDASSMSCSWSGTCWPSVPAARFGSHVDLVSHLAIDDPFTKSRS